MEYTKGDWKHTEDGVIIAEDGKQIASVFPRDKEANAHLISSAPACYEELKSTKDWLSNFVMRFYIAAGNPTYERMKKLYQELDEFQREIGVKALAKAEGK